MAEPRAKAIYTPLKVGFDSEVEITVHSAFIQTARLLQCDPIAHVSVVTVHKAGTMHRSNGIGAAGEEEVKIIKEERPVASTRRLYFTSRPAFNETLRFVIPCSQLPKPTAKPELRGLLRKISSPNLADGENEEYSTANYLLISLVDAQGNGHGQAVCPFLLHVPTICTEPQRIMLQPRNRHNKGDPLFKSDMALLARHGVDDFGFITVSWRVSLVPHGGALISAVQSSVSVPAFPLGLVLRATWLLTSNVHQRGAQYTVSVEFGGQDRFLFDGTAPLFLTIQNATQLQQAIVHCTLQNAVSRPQSYDVAVPLPIPPIASFALERDVWWTTPVRTSCGMDLGILVASVRLAKQPLDGSTPFCTNDCCSDINDPIHQSQYTHVAKDWGRPPPNTPHGAYYPLFWESAHHIARVAERQWRHECVVGACPSVEHVRHLLEVIAGRAPLDTGVNNVLAVYFDHGHHAQVQQQQLKQFIVSCAFHAKGMTVQEAARFCFFALRREMEQAITKEDVVFILEHALVGKTVDMPEKEVHRRINDIFGDGVYVTYDDFQRYFINNYAMWYQFGIPITTGNDQTARNTLDVALETGVSRETAPAAKDKKGGDKRRSSSPVPAVGGGKEAEGPPVDLGDSSVWRRFIVRVQHSNKAFSVTAHMNDTISEVMVMVQNSTGIRALCQEWRANGVTLDPKATVGSTKLGLTARNDAHPEVIIVERDEMLRLVMFYKEKSLRWEVRILETERVLKLRSLVQQKTLIPLSRCVMCVNGHRLQDRHPLQHYQLQNGDVIEVRQE
uniref:Uncharacterized protein TCIL3000_10_10350 n=1 Tax=Trypanosoma congolense (strain IL3000) TaxID=1068625 RepID=G0UXY9_TRYCI|nr:unnamed protein product [Trypanosoma congolense IL3000]